MKRGSRWVAGLVTAAVTLGVGSVGPAGAVDGVGVTPNPVFVGADQSVATVTVSWSGAVPQQLMFIGVCKKSIGDLTFLVDEDCSSVAETNPNGTADGAGSAQQELFRGQDPTGERWGCYAPGDTPPPGVEKFTTCFVRVTDTSVLNSEVDVEVPFTFEGSSRVDPGVGESPGGPAPPPPTLDNGAARAAGAVVTAPTGDPAPGESIQVFGAAGVAGVSITG